MSVLALEGPENPDVPLLLDSPHSGTDYPDDFAPLVGPERYRRAEDTDVASPLVLGVLMSGKDAEVTLTIDLP